MNIGSRRHRTRGGIKDKQDDSRRNSKDGSERKEIL